MSFVPAVTVDEAASGVPPVTDAAAEDCVTAMACEPSASVELAERPLNPTAAPPVASSSDDALVTTDPVELTPPAEASTLPCASWSTVKLAVPCWAPGEAVALATDESDDVAAMRFHEPGVPIACAAVTSAWKSELIVW